MLFVAAAPAWAAKIKDGIVPAKAVPIVRTYLGDYIGQWNTETTEYVYDDISRYELEAPVMRLSLDQDNRLTVKFYMDQEAARIGDELDLLGFACLSRAGNLLELTLPPERRAAKEPTDELQTALEATFDFIWGRCPARIHAVDSNDLQIALAVNPVDREYVVKASLLRKVQADTQVYAKVDGAYQKVKVRRAKRDPDSVASPPLEFCVESVEGEIEGCFRRESEVKAFIIPVPLFGLSANWYSATKPKFKVEKGIKLIYHEAVFRREFTDPALP